MTSRQDLERDLRVLRHAPGTALRELEEWLAAERRKADKKGKKKAEADALHLLKTSHGAVKALNELFLKHVAEGQPTTPAKPASSESKSSVAAALEAGQKWRDDKKRRATSGATVDQIRRLRAEAYRPGNAETTGVDRTQRRWPR